MVFADWTHSGSYSSAALDAAIKYAGSSSCKLTTTTAVHPKTCVLTHDTFLEPQLQALIWIYRTSCVDEAHPRVKHSSYGSLDTYSYTTVATWERFRFTFWYDIGANTKWGRLEKWSGSAWEQQGSDTNFGAGSPVAGAIALECYSKSGSSTGNAWFDEVEVSA